jgi:acyl-coenzyme A thioesterase PaaI-like protein
LNQPIHSTIASSSWLRVRQTRSAISAGRLDPEARAVAVDERAHFVRKAKELPLFDAGGRPKQDLRATCAG